MIKRILFLSILMFSTIARAELAPECAVEPRSISCMYLTWDTPTEYEDGRSLTQIDRYVIYYSIDNVVQDPIEVPASNVDYTLVDIAQGRYIFQISTVSLGVEGLKSNPITETLAGGIPVTIELTVRVIK